MKRFTRIFLILSLSFWHYRRELKGRNRQIERKENPTDTASDTTYKHKKIIQNVLTGAQRLTFVIIVTWWKYNIKSIVTHCQQVLIVIKFMFVAAYKRMTLRSSGRNLLMHLCGRWRKNRSPFIVTQRTSMFDNGERRVIGGTKDARGS